MIRISPWCIWSGSQGKCCKWGWRLEMSTFCHTKPPYKPSPIPSWGERGWVGDDSLHYNSFGDTVFEWLPHYFPLTLVHDKRSLLIWEFLSLTFGSPLLWFHSAPSQRDTPERGMKQAHQEKRNGSQKTPVNEITWLIFSGIFIFLCAAKFLPAANVLPYTFNCSSPEICLWIKNYTVPVSLPFQQTPSLMWASLHSLLIPHYWHLLYVFLLMDLFRFRQHSGFWDSWSTNLLKKIIYNKACFLSSLCSLETMFLFISWYNMGRLICIHFFFKVVKSYTFSDDPSFHYSNSLPPHNCSPWFLWLSTLNWRGIWNLPLFV